MKHQFDLLSKPKNEGPRTLRRFGSSSMEGGSQNVHGSVFLFFKICYFVYRVLLSLCMRVDAYFRFGCDRDSGDRSQCAGKMGQEG